MGLRFTEHAEQMLLERRIEREWVESAVAQPHHHEERQDGTVHYLKSIPERGDRILRVIVNPEEDPPSVVTAFFDRRLTRSKP